MNEAKLKVYRKVLHDVCETFDREVEFINEKTEKSCCQEKLSVEEVTYIVYEKLHFVVCF